MSKRDIARRRESIFVWRAGGKMTLEADKERKPLTRFFNVDPSRKLIQERKLF